MFKLMQKKSHLRYLLLFVINCIVCTIINDHNKIGKSLENYEHLQMFFGITKISVKTLKIFKNHKTLKDKLQRNVNELEYKIKLEGLNMQQTK